jgi:uncharacterized membrane protein
MVSSPADARWPAGQPDAPSVEDMAAEDGAEPAGPDKAGPDERRSGSAVMRGARRIAVVVLAAAAVLTVVALISLWPSAPKKAPADTSPRHRGEVVSVTRVRCPDPSPDLPNQVSAMLGDSCGSVAVRVSSGPDKGQRVTTQLPSGPGAPSVRPGDSVVLMYLSAEDADHAYVITDQQRGHQLWVLVIAFALAVVAFGRWRGLTALAGLAVTFAVLLLFIVPAILAGQPPLLVAIVGSAAIMLFVLYLTHGLNATTSVAILGVLASLVLTGALATVSVAATHLTGVVSEDDLFFSTSFRNVNMQGLLLAAILVGSLGVLDDVAVTQAVTVAELAQANPASRPLALYRSAMRVGRAHIASVINTIILAYAGASLPVLLLITAYNQSLAVTLTSQFLAQEIVRSIVGTLGLIAAVPITTALASLTIRPVTARRSWPIRPSALRRAAPAPNPASGLRPSLKIKNEGERYEALLFRPGHGD